MTAVISPDMPADGHIRFLLLFFFLTIYHFQMTVSQLQTEKNISNIVLDSQCQSWSWNNSTAETHYCTAVTSHFISEVQNGTDGCLCASAGKRHWERGRKSSALNNWKEKDCGEVLEIKTEREKSLLNRNSQSSPQWPIYNIWPMLLFDSICRVGSTQLIGPRLLCNILGVIQQGPWLHPAWLCKRVCICVCVYSNALGNWAKW